MRIFNVVIPSNKALTNYDILQYAQELGISSLKTVCMLDDLPLKTCKSNKECCGIVNLNKTGEKGSHWVAYWVSSSDDDDNEENNDEEHKQRIYFDSFGQITPIEIQKYLKTRDEFRLNKRVIQRNTDIVQSINSCICGQLCLFVLKALSERWSYQDILNVLRRQVEKET